MKTYTVIGFHSDNDQRWARTVSAESPDHAEEVALHPPGGSIHICAVIEGDHQCVDTEMYLNPRLP